MQILATKYSFAMSLLFALASSQAMAAQSCRALVLVKNDLWFAQQNGNLISQLTNDGNMKIAVALAPDGNLIAYSGKSSPADITLIDSSGKLVADVNLNAKDAITWLTWTSPSLLEARQHVSPSNNQSFFLYVPPPLGPAQVLSAKGSGRNCSISPKGNDVACIRGDAINLNGRNIYFLASPFASSNVLQKLNVAVGASVLTMTTPAFRIEVLGVAENKVSLKVTTPDGQWKQAYLVGEDVLEVPYSTDNSEDSPVLYGIRAAVGSGNYAVAAVEVIASKMGSPSLEVGPIWDPRGKRIAFVENNGSNQRSLVLINREPGGADQNKGGLEANERLPITGPITAMAFTSDTHIVVKGRDTVFEQDIPPVGKVPINTPYALTPSLPQQLNVIVGGSPIPTPVKGWTCQ